MIKDRQHIFIMNLHRITNERDENMKKPKNNI